MGTLYDDRLSALREQMLKNDITYALFTSKDPHNSEYVCSHYETGRFLSGFTGSDSSTLLVGLEEAWLWTDGRYFTQAHNQIGETKIILMKIGVKGVDSLTDFLKKSLTAGDGLWVCPETLNASLGLNIKKLCKKAGAFFSTKGDILTDIWHERDSLPCGEVSVLPIEISGEPVTSKLQKLRKALNEADCEGLFVSKLDEIMWLFNIRGCDVRYNPVALSYAFVDKKRAVLFIQEKAIAKELFQYAKEASFEILPYEKYKKYLKKNLNKNMAVLLDVKNTSYAGYKLIKKCSGRIVDKNSIVDVLKAVKNQVELRNIRDYFVRDSVAVIKFLYYMSKKAEYGAITELEAASVLESYRKEIDGYLYPSFATISAYGSNAAMAHYEPTEDKPVVIDKKGLLLVDSGGQYSGATTDVTRTFSCGRVKKEEKKAFTLVLKGWISLMNATFLEGTTGKAIDILARKALWNEGMDFRHGTGHGVGCFLSVHEGPQSISQGVRAEVKLLPGMLVTDEPGMYEEGRYGIRTENTLVVVKKKKTAYGDFLGFESLTYVPVDRKCIDLSLLTAEEIKEIDDYHKNVYEKTSVFLDAKQKKWLKSMCKPLVNS